MQFLTRILRGVKNAFSKPFSTKLVVITLKERDGSIIGALDSLTAYPNVLHFTSAAAVSEDGRPLTAVTRIEINQRDISSIRIINVH